MLMKQQNRITRKGQVQGTGKRITLRSAKKPWPYPWEKQEARPALPCLLWNLAELGHGLPSRRSGETAGRGGAELGSFLRGGEMMRKRRR